MSVRGFLVPKLALGSVFWLTLCLWQFAMYRRYLKYFENDFKLNSDNQWFETTLFALVFTVYLSYTLHLAKMAATRPSV